MTATTKNNARGQAGEVGNAESSDSSDSTLAIKVCNAKGVQPDLKEARRFIEHMFGRPDAQLTFQTFDDDKSRRQSDLARIFHGTLDQHYPALVRLQSAGAGVFWMVNAGDGRGRQARNVTSVRCLFADADSAPFEPIVDALRPHALVESSPGKWQVFYRVDGCQLDRFGPFQKAIARKFGTDGAVADLPRVMRMPGFFHQKGEPHMVRTVVSNDMPAYSTTEIELDLLGGDAIDGTPSSTPDHIPDRANRSATEADRLKARELALGRARHTHADPESSRHGAVLGLGGDLCREGLPDDDAVFDVSLAVFDDNMRDTDSVGNPSGLNWQAESDAIRAGYAAAVKAGEFGARTDGDAFEDLGELPDDAEMRRRFRYPERISCDEWSAARSSPDCIVANYLWCDVAVMVAPGGVGKTTLALYEAIHVALARPLYGLAVRRAGDILLLTAEDSREMLVARLRDIAAALWLTAEEIALLWRRVRIADLSGAGFKLTRVRGDVVEPDRGVDDLIAACRENPPVMIIVDPAVSFGVGEARVNDAEQGLIEAGRRIRNALNCCVRFIHHTGKMNAREKTLDQYSGRGGSAFADGSRMVAVLASLDGAEFYKATGRPLADGESAVVVARPKTTYAPPQPPIYIVRRGYAFMAIDSLPAAPSIEGHADSVQGLLMDELRAGNFPTKKSLEAIATNYGIKRQEVRDSISVLLAAGRIEERDRPNAGRGGAHKFLWSECFAEGGMKTANQSPKADVK